MFPCGGLLSWKTNPEVDKAPQNVSAMSAAMLISAGASLSHKELIDVNDAMQGLAAECEPRRYKTPLVIMY